MSTPVLRTLAYADIFNYPITSSQIHRWLITSRQASFKNVNAIISELVRLRRIKKIGSYYILANRQKLVSQRKKNARLNRTKFSEARRVGEWLKIFPTITLVAVTGALAMRNATKEDDIDLLVVTRPNTLWFTRLLVVPLVSLIAKRRTPHKDQKLPVENYSNAICLNLWLDETALSVPQPQRSLYIAHEVTQIKPLWSRGKAAENFLAANSWITRHLANCKISVKKERRIPQSTSLVVKLLNLLFFKVQFEYMKSKITRERVTLHTAFFHPKNMQKYVREEYQKRLKKLNIKA